MDSNELAILEVLEDLLSGAHVRERIDDIAGGLERQLAQNPGAQMVWEPIPLELYGAALPAGIRSSWVFILRAGAVTGAERHPNSHQRVVSWRGAGDLQVRDEGPWRSHPLVSEPGAPIERRWASIPANVWHQAVVPHENWGVASFHTVEPQELIEERPQGDGMVRKHYLAN